MLKKLWLNLQLFADGGDGGGGGSSSSSSTGESVGSNESGEIEIPSSVPERARKNYQEAMKKHSGSTTKADTQKTDTAQPTNEQGATGTMSYEDFIKEHKDEHKAYMDKTIGDRLKKYKGIESDLEKHKELLNTVAFKYGVNPDSDNFLQSLAEKIEADDSYFENYAMEHDMTAEDARRVVTLERKAAQYDAVREQQEKQEQMRQHIMVLQQNAEKTKKQFPDFDLETEMQDERFRRLCAANQGDTTSAYMACHWNEIIPATVQRASRQIQEQTAQSVASNQSRPIENGMSSSAPSVVQQDFSNMSLKQLRAFADEQRRKTGR